tara:strand:- start:52 stop:591 length:540 start_codon:yes stop_codon:yes gene_type:complete
MNEFVCPNGRMSVNGVCPIFEGDDGQKKDFTDKSGYFQWDFDEPTKTSKESADSIIKQNINYYTDFVENTLGIPSNIQTGLKVATSLGSVMTGGGIVGALTPFAIPFVAGAAIRNNQSGVQQAIARESRRDLQSRIDAGQFGSVTQTNLDAYRGGGQFSGGPSKSGGFDSAERGGALHG